MPWTKSRLSPGSLGQKNKNIEKYKLVGSGAISTKKGGLGTGPWQHFPYENNKI